MENKDNDYITKLITSFPDKHRKHYNNALAEINSGGKKSHWIWYLIPTPPYIVNGKEKVTSENKNFALRDNEKDNKGIKAAKAYLNYNKEDIKLGENYYNLLNAIDKKITDYNSANALLGDDVAKLLSSVKLFELITRNSNSNKLYENINRVCNSIQRKLELQASFKVDEVKAEEEEEEEDYEEENDMYFNIFNYENKTSSEQTHKIYYKDSAGGTDNDRKDNKLSDILMKKSFNYIIYSNKENKVSIINVKRYYSLKDILSIIYKSHNKIIIISRKKTSILNKYEDYDTINLIFIYELENSLIINELGDNKLMKDITYEDYIIVCNSIYSKGDESPQQKLTPKPPNKRKTKGHNRRHISTVPAVPP